MRPLEYAELCQKESLMLTVECSWRTKPEEPGETFRSTSYIVNKGHGKDVPQGVKPALVDKEVRR